MKQLKFYIVSLFLILIIKSGYSQGYASAELGLAYGSGIFKNSVETFVNTKFEETTYFSENKKFSLGSGFRVYANGFYHFQENIAIGLGIMKNFNQDVEFMEVNAVSGIVSENTRTLSASRLSFRPMIQLNTDFDKLNVFLQLGFSFNSTKQKLHESISISNKKTEYFWEYSGTSGMGYFTSLGLSYKLNKEIGVNFGISLDNYQYSPSNNYLKKLTEDGINMPLADLKEIDKTVTFSDWVSDQYSQNPDLEKPLELPKQTFVYNSISIFLGLSYQF